MSPRNVRARLHRAMAGTPGMALGSGLCTHVFTTLPGALTQAGPILQMGKLRLETAVGLAPGGRRHTRTQARFSGSLI